jgi:hypothetical protein
MAKPKLRTLTKDVWTKVATSASSMVINVMKPGVMYLQTYRMAGEAAPTNKKEGVEFEDQLSVYPDHNLDIYIMPLGDTGQVRISYEDLY